MTTVLIVIGVLATIVALTVAGLALFTGSVARKVEAFLPPEGAFIEVDGHRLHYVEQGEGPPIVMIHGLGGQGRHFTHSLVDRLKDDYRVIVVDRPGSGHSVRRPGSSAALFSQAKTIADFIRTLGLGRPLVVGHSLGGALALALALEHPDVVGGLALLAPLTHPQDEVPEPFRGLAVASPLARRLVAWTLAIPGAMSRREVVLRTVFGPEEPLSDFATRGGGLLGARPSAFIGASEDLNAVNIDLPSMVGRYGEIGIPIGILFGKGDQVLDYRANAESMAAKVGGLELELLDERGHMIPMTAPEESAAFVRRMAARLAA